MKYPYYLSSKALGDVSYNSFRYYEPIEMKIDSVQCKVDRAINSDEKIS